MCYLENVKKTTHLAVPQLFIFSLKHKHLSAANFAFIAWRVFLEHLLHV